MLIDVFGEEIEDRMKMTVIVEKKEVDGSGVFEVFKARLHFIFQEIPTGEACTSDHEHFTGELPDAPSLVTDPDSPLEHHTLSFCSASRCRPRNVKRHNTIERTKLYIHRLSRRHFRAPETRSTLVGCSCTVLANRKCDVRLAAEG